MPIKGVLLLLLAAIIVAVVERDVVYDWFVKQFLHGEDDDFKGDKE